MTKTTKIQFGDNLEVTDVAPGTIRVDATGGGGGGGGGGASFVFTQSSPSAVWSVTHGLGLFPSVSVVDSGDSTVEPDVHYDNSNALTITFGSATSGKAYLN